jgi:cytosine/adenosine deaminase-related metal-dependent hydrolase
MAADLVAFDLNDPGFAGAEHDLLAALVFCAPARTELSIIHGRIVVRDGRLTTVDLPSVLERHRALVRALLRGD